MTETTTDQTEDLPTLADENVIDEDVIDEDLTPPTDPTRPVRRRGLGTRLDTLTAAAAHEAARATTAGHGLAALLNPTPGQALAGRDPHQPASAAPASTHPTRQPITDPITDATAQPTAPALAGGSDPRRDGQLLAEAQWLITPTSRVLHHHAPDRAGADQLLIDGWIEQDGAPVPLSLSCGRAAWTVVAPNALERHTLPRCEDCCAALGMPDGVGSPVNDPVCQPTLTGRITAVAAHPTAPAAGGHP